MIKSMTGFASLTAEDDCAGLPDAEPNPLDRDAWRMFRDKPLLPVVVQPAAKAAVATSRPDPPTRVTN